MVNCAAKALRRDDREGGRKCSSESSGASLETMNRGLSVREQGWLNFTAPMSSWCLGWAACSRLPSTVSYCFRRSKPDAFPPMRKSMRWAPGEPGRRNGAGDLRLGLLCW